MTRAEIFLILALLILVAFSALGCGPKGPPKKEVVTYRVRCSAYGQGAYVTWGTESGFREDWTVNGYWQKSVTIDGLFHGSVSAVGNGRVYGEVETSITFKGQEWKDSSTGRDAGVVTEGWFHP